ncbi:MAG: hypothetical protein KGJ84_13035 [Elusimicrobia bacterium]|nr:hypothetical protein [Elusimicrobiota bacterium]
MTTVMTNLSRTDGRMKRASAASFALLSGIFASALAFGGEATLTIVPPASAALQPAGEAAPNATVSATKPPVKLTLAVYRTTLERRDDFTTEVDWDALDKEHPPEKDGIRDLRNVDTSRYMRRKRVKVGEPLWVKIRLTNVSEKSMFVTDDLFTGPKDFQHALEDGFFGVSLIIRNQNGKTVKWTPDAEPDIDLCPEADSAPHEPPDPNGKAKIDAWKRAGYPLEKINSLLDAESKAARARLESRHPIKTLGPGESIATGPWRYRGLCKADSAKLPQQVGDYGELWNFHLDEPGTYTIRARYHDDPYSNNGKPIAFETAPIKIKVLP